MRVLTDRFDPHLLDVATMFQKSRNQVYHMTICRFWIKSAVHLRPISDEHSTTYGRINNKSKSDDIKFIFNLLSKLSLGVNRQDPFQVQLRKAATENNVHYLLQLEKQE